MEWRPYAGQRHATNVAQTKAHVGVGPCTLTSRISRKHFPAVHRQPIIKHRSQLPLALRAASRTPIPAVVDLPFDVVRFSLVALISSPFAPKLSKSKADASREPTQEI